MIYATGRLIRRFPRLTMLLSGLWITVSPWLFFLLMRQMRSRDLLPAGIETFLNEIGDLPSIIIFFFGIGLVAASIGWMMIRLVIYTFRQYPI